LAQLKNAAAWMTSAIDLPAIMHHGDGVRDPPDSNTGSNPVGATISMALMFLGSVFQKL